MITVEGKPQGPGRDHKAVINVIGDTESGISFACPNCQNPVEFSRDPNPNHPKHNYVTGTCVCGRIHWVDWNRGIVHFSFDAGSDTMVGQITYQKHSTQTLNSVVSKK